VKYAMPLRNQNFLKVSLKVKGVIVLGITELYLLYAVNVEEEDL
jgi:hypothetical protein